MKSYSWREVGKHNTFDDIWVSIRGKVYDLTSFIKRHPGGFDPLIFSAGKDATVVFETYHPLETSSMLKKFEIGVLSDHEYPLFPEPNAFNKVLRDRVKEYFVKSGKDPKFSWWIVGRYTFIYSLFLISYLASLYFAREFFSLAMVSSVFLGVGAALIGLQPLHDSSHFAVGRNMYVWRALGATHDFLNGCSWVNWCYSHIMGHHPFTNIVGYDPDISTSDTDFRRIKKIQPWLPFYLGQHIYAPILYGALAVKVRISDLTCVFSNLNAGIRMNPLTNYHKFAFFGGKLFFALYRIVLPSMLFGWQKASIMLLIADLTTSYYLTICFQASHVISDVDWIYPGKDMKIKKDWFELQVDTAQDYAHDSWLITFFTGSLNYQICHHLFPGVCQVHYPAITPIIKETCKEYGIRYRLKDNFIEAVGDHIGYLKELGNDHRNWKIGKEE